MIQRVFFYHPSRTCNLSKSGRIFQHRQSKYSRPTLKQWIGQIGPTLHMMSVPNNIDDITIVRDGRTNLKEIQRSLKHLSFSKYFSEDAAFIQTLLAHQKPTLESLSFKLIFTSNHYHVPIYTTHVVETYLGDFLTNNKKLKSFKFQILKGTYDNGFSNSVALKFLSIAYNIESFTYRGMLTNGIAVDNLLKFTQTHNSLKEITLKLPSGRYGVSHEFFTSFYTRLLDAIVLRKNSKSFAVTLGFNINFKDTKNVFFFRWFEATTRPLLCMGVSLN